MKLNRTEAREKIMIILYQIDLYDKDKIPYDLESVFHENLEIDNKFVRDIVDGVLEKKDCIDKIISKYLENWDFDTPDVVAINEAVELAKKYSDEKIVKLINAVLDKIRDNEEVDE